MPPGQACEGRIAYGWRTGVPQKKRRRRTAAQFLHRARRHRPPFWAANSGASEALACCNRPRRPPELDLETEIARREVRYTVPWERRLETGLFFHLIGALSEYGKVGLTAIGNSREEAEELYESTVAIFDRETGPAGPRGGT